MEQLKKIFSFMMLLALVSAGVLSGCNSNSTSTKKPVIKNIFSYHVGYIEKNVLKNSYKITENANELEIQARHFPEQWIPSPSFPGVPPKPPKYIPEEYIQKKAYLAFDFSNLTSIDPSNIQSITLKIYRTYKTIYVDNDNDIYGKVQAIFCDYQIPLKDADWNCIITATPLIMLQENLEKQTWFYLDLTEQIKERIKSGNSKIQIHLKREINDIKDPTFNEYMDGFENKNNELKPRLEVKLFE